MGGDTTAPNPIVGAEEVAHYGTFEGDDGRENVGCPVAPAKDKVRKNPQHEGINACAEGSAYDKL